MEPENLLITDYHNVLHEKFEDVSRHLPVTVINQKEFKSTIMTRKVILYAKHYQLLHRSVLDIQGQILN